MYAKLFLNTSFDKTRTLSHAVYSRFLTLNIFFFLTWRWGQRTLTSQCVFSVLSSYTTARNQCCKEGEVLWAWLANTVISIRILGPYSPWHPRGAGGDWMFSEVSVNAGYCWCCRPITLYLFYLDFSNWKKIRCQDFAFCWLYYQSLLCNHFSYSWY